MKLTKRILPLALMAVAYLFQPEIKAQNFSTIINFENGNYHPNTPTTHTPIDNGFVNNTYFQDAYGITFSCVDDNGNANFTPRYAQIGGQITAFSTNPAGTYTTTTGGNCSGQTTNLDNPYATPYLDEGCFFLTDDDGSVLPNPKTLRIDYDRTKQNCKDASGYLIDVDGQEVFMIRAYTNGNFTTPEQFIHIVSPFHNNPGQFLNPYSNTSAPAGDASSAYWQITTNDFIDRIEIDFVGANTMNVGIAFDEFSYCSLSDCFGVIDPGFHVLNNYGGTGRVKAFNQTSLGNSNYTIKGYEWSIDGQYHSSDQHFENFFSTSGSYTICLRITAINNVTGRCCVEEICETIDVEVNSSPCMLEPDFSYRCYSDDCIFSFNGSVGSGTNRNISSWYWDFGDGTHAFGQYPLHTYTAPGLYTVCLTVVGYDPNGSSCCVETYCRNINFDCIGVPAIQELCDFSTGGPGFDDPDFEIGKKAIDNGDVSESDQNQQLQNALINDVKVVPNPVVNQAELSFNLSQEVDNMNIILIDIMTGNEVSVVSQKLFGKGTHQIMIDAQKYNSGTYVIKLSTDNESKTVKMLKSH